MAEVSIKNVQKNYGDLEIIKDISLDVKSGELVVFVGPSGCGKSTLLRMIAGLEDINSGTISIDNQEINDITPSRRGVAMVFQSYALYPHMNVYKNMAFGLKLAKTPKDIMDTQVRKAAKILQIEDLLERLPKELSGGQRQRVAIGRAIVRNPKVFLFDEPLSNLDAALRVQTRIEIERLHHALQATMIYVTHDQIEAMTLADKIVVLNKGNIEQIGTPRQIYNNPKNIFVAGFIGNTKMNFLHVTTDANGENSYVQSIKLPKNQKITLGARPEHISISNKQDADMSGKIDIIENLGEYSIIYIRLANNDIITMKTDILEKFAINDDIHIKFNTEKMHVFDENGNILIKEKS